ncbi:MAG TPA: glycosyltransferase family 4 protein [Kofleriaceae bacterium]|nr:glycosyltransferase family 4 protein [Kofleriaceae bacterium]
MSTCAVDVPPRAYGGTELFVANLARELVARGHQVVVYATGSSHPDGELRWRFARPIWPPSRTYEVEHSTWAWRDIATSGFDLVHVNGPEGLIAPNRIDVPTIVTVHHSRNDEANAMMRSAAPAHVVAISRRQAELVPEIGVSAVIHHGLATRLYPEGAGTGGYAAFLGRLAPEKGAHIAIDVAREAGIPLRIGGPYWAGIPELDQYFHAEIRPRLERAGSELEWLGELGHDGKVALLRGARATLMPIEWEEPFGLVMIESMLVGTPVIVFGRGSAPEIVDEGVTGFVVRDADEMRARLADVHKIDRAACRARARARWSSERMTTDYQELYRRVIGIDQDEVEAA